MPADQTPSSGQDGILWDGAMIPVSAPLSYVPCKGEAGIKAGGTFLPLEPLNKIIRFDDMPVVTTTLPINRSAPWIDQSGVTAATPCIAPYDWSLSAANRTLILDTDPTVPANGNPGLLLASKTAGIADQEVTRAAGAFRIGDVYTIKTVGTTDFRQVGAANNNVGTTFTCSAVGYGTGTVKVTVASTALVNGRSYTILTTGADTDFTMLGAANNNAGTTFVATNWGWTTPGTGKVSGTIMGWDIEPGNTYTIVTVAGTDFTMVGAPNNNVGTTFVATDWGWDLSGSGTVSGTFSKDSIQPGETYTIFSLGANVSNFTLIGAADNNVGTTFTATGWTPGSGTATTVITAGSFVYGATYTIVSAGTTDFTALGAADNAPNTVFINNNPKGNGNGVATMFTASGAAEIIWTYGSSPVDPQPTLRTSAAVGTVFTAGVPFIPGTAGSTVNGTLKVRSYRYGLQLSGVASYSVRVKVGKSLAVWSKIASTLTLSTPTSGATIKYSVDGSTPTLTYSAPLSITDTTTVKWFATKASMVDSDTWTAVIPFADAEGPDDFSVTSISTLPAIGADQNTTVNVALQFQRKADWYISPSGTGDGLTSSTPGSAAAIFGLNTATGKARGTRYINMQKSNSTVYLAPSWGGDITGLTFRYSLEGGANFSTYTSGDLVPAAPGRVWAKLIRADSTDATRLICQPWYMGTGTGVQIRSQWSLAAQTLTLTYEPTPFVPEDISMLYSLDGSTPNLPYTGPITLLSDCTPKVKAVHVANADNRNDFATATAVYTLAAITIASTADYNNTADATWAAVVTPPSWDKYYYTQPDVIWACEGEYNPPTTAATACFSNYVPGANGVILRGGYSTDFKARDVRTYHTLFKAKKWTASPHDLVNTYIIYSPAGTLDGLYLESEIAVNDPADNSSAANAWVAQPYVATYVFNCHISMSGEFPGGNLYNPQNEYLVTINAAGTAYGGAYYCTATYDFTVAAAKRGVDFGSGPPIGSGSVQGGPGPSNTYSFALGNGASYYSDLTVIIAMGDGGRGGDAGPDAVGDVVYGQGGKGGHAHLTVSAATYTGGTTTLNITGGNGGRGGDAGSARVYTWGGSGGDSSIGITVSGYPGTSNATVTSGNGGVGGNAAWDRTYSEDGVAGAGGSASVTATCPNGTNVVCSAGNGGDAGTRNPTWDNSSNNYLQGGGSSSCVAALNGGAVNTTLSSGAAGKYMTGYKLYPPDRTDINPNSYDGTTRCVLNCQPLTGMTLRGSATCGATRNPAADARLAYWVALPLAPVFFLPGDFQFSEGVPYGAGNPVRVNAVAPSTIGWYSGTVDSNGAPLSGYETPRGTGVALGRYWE